MFSVKKLLPAFISLGLATGMVVASELLQDKEIIFPEITAITIGALAAPKQAWNTSRIRLLLTITAAAVIGVGLVVLAPVELVFKVPIAILCAITCVTISGTEFLPAISACVLPVLLETRSPVYIISVVTMTSLILLTQYLLERCGIRNQCDFTPVKPDRALIVLRAKQIIVISVLCIIPTMTKEIFFIAPPLIVAFFEMSKPGSRLLDHSLQAVTLIIIGAVSGVLSRFLLTESLGLPLAVSACVASTIILIAVCTMKLYFPPCGAIATLPFIIPESAMFRFPLEITGGMLVLVLAAAVISKEQTIRIKVKKMLRQQT